MALNIHKFLLISIALSSSHGAYSATYPEGTFTIKPLNFGMLNLTPGRVKQDIKLNGLRAQAFKVSPTFFVNELEKYVRGYSIEFGYFYYTNFEFQARLSYVEDGALGNAVPIESRDYLFRDRNNFAASLGTNYFFDVSENWLPYIGATVGYIYQDKTRAEVFTTDPLGRPLSDLGKVRLQNSLMRFTGSLNVGIDYRFNDCWALTFSSGLKYLDHPIETRQIFQGLPTSFRDNDDEITFPLAISIKRTFK